VGLWLGAAPLVLASRSQARRALLEAAAVPVEVCPADVDERALEAAAGSSDAETVAGLLARAKAVSVSERLPDRLVLGADQTLALDGRRFSKPADRNAAREQLLSLRGRTHALHSAIALAQGPDIIFEHVGVARLTMRPFTDEFLDAYLDTAGPAATASVGAYQLEKTGIHLFEQVEGDHFTILGLPVLPLLHFLRGTRLLA
jgi:septum formation protein